MERKSPEDLCCDYRRFVEVHEEDVDCEMDIRREWLLLIAEWHWWSVLRKRYGNIDGTWGWSSKELVVESLGK